MWEGGYWYSFKFQSCYLMRYQKSETVISQVTNYKFVSTYQFDLKRQNLIYVQHSGNLSMNFHRIARGRNHAQE